MLSGSMGSAMYFLGVSMGAGIFSYGISAIK